MFMEESDADTSEDLADLEDTSEDLVDLDVEGDEVGARLNSLKYGWFKASPAVILFLGSYCSIFWRTEH